MKFEYVLVGMLLVCITGGSIFAQEGRAPAGTPKALVPSALVKAPSKRGGVSVRQAITLAQEETGGRVLSSKSFNSGGQGAKIYQIRLLVEGERVITVVVDAKGRVRRR
jgi:hypothetical protein